MTNQTNAEQFELLDINNWPRKQHFEFYNSFAQPYFQLGCDLNAKPLLEYCKRHQIAFFEAYLYLAQEALNNTDAMRLRIVDSQVRDYKGINISVTVLAEDQTFRFCTVPYCDDFAAFSRAFKKAKAEAVSKPFIDHDFFSQQQQMATVYMSVIPWFSFNGYRHAWLEQNQDSTGIPRIVFGKMDGDSHKMPMTVDAHHALVDGLDVAKFIEALQYCFSHPNLI